MPDTKTVNKTKKKIIKKKVVAVKKEKEAPEIKEKRVRFFEGLGRRKTSVARVRLLPSDKKSVSVNGKTLEAYFPTIQMQQTVLSPLDLTDSLNNFSMSVKVKGGGLNSQSEAVRHGLSKALMLFNPEFRAKLNPAGFLTRDSRMRERKKFGLKRARRAPQWQKR